MDNHNYIEVFRDIALKNGIEMSDNELCERFYKLSNCLCEANKIHNLTAIKDEEGIMVKHFVDSLFISHLIDPNSKVASGLPYFMLFLMVSEKSTVS